MDRAISLGAGDFLVLMTSAGEPELHRLDGAISADLDAAQYRCPFVSLPRSAVTTVTTDRPLPAAGPLQAVHAAAPNTAAFVG